VECGVGVNRMNDSWHSYKYSEVSLSISVYSHYCVRSVRCYSLLL